MAQQDLPIGIVQDKETLSDPLLFWKLTQRLNAVSVEFKYEAELDVKYGLRRTVAKQIRKEAIQRSTLLSVHAPYNPGVNMGEACPKVQRFTRTQMENSLQFCAELGAKYMTVHGGHVEVPPRDIKRQPGTSPEPLALRASVPRDLFDHMKARTLENLAWLIETATRYGVMIALENFHDCSNFKVRFPIVPEDFQDCGDILGDGLFINYDSGHGNSTGIHILDFINQVGIQRIVGTHLHDNHGAEDQHLPAFSGTVDFNSFLKAYRDNEWDFTLNLEMKNAKDLETSFLRLRKWNSVGWPIVGEGDLDVRNQRSAKEI